MRLKLELECEHIDVHMLAINRGTSIQAIYKCAHVGSKPHDSKGFARHSSTNEDSPSCAVNIACADNGAYSYKPWASWQVGWGKWVVGQLPWAP